MIIRKRISQYASCLFADCTERDPFLSACIEDPSFSANHQTCKFPKTTSIRLSPSLSTIQRHATPTLVSSQLPPPTLSLKARPSFLTLLKHPILQLIRQPLMRLHARIAMHIPFTTSLHTAPIVSHPESSKLPLPRRQKAERGRRRVSLTPTWYLS